MENLKPLSVRVSFFALARETMFIEAHSIESRCYRSGKCTVCRRVRAAFSPEILQAGAVKGLNYDRNRTDVSKANPVLDTGLKTKNKTNKKLKFLFSVTPGTRSPHCCDNREECLCNEEPGSSGCDTTSADPRANYSIHSLSNWPSF